MHDFVVPKALREPTRARLSGLRARLKRNSIAAPKHCLAQILLEINIIRFRQRLTAHASPLLTLRKKGLAANRVNAGP